LLPSARPKITPFTNVSKTEKSFNSFIQVGYIVRTGNDQAEQGNFPEISIGSKNHRIKELFLEDDLKKVETTVYNSRAIC